MGLKHVQRPGEIKNSGLDYITKMGTIVNFTITITGPNANL